MGSVRSAPYKAVLGVLIAARARAGLTQQELASRLDKPQSFVSKYENGERRVDVAEFIQILHALGADPQAAIAEILRNSAFRKPARRR